MTTFNSAKQEQMQVQNEISRNRIRAVENNSKAPTPILEGAGIITQHGRKRYKRRKSNLLAPERHEENSSPHGSRLIDDS